MKFVTASSNRELDEIFDLIGFSVQLTKPQFDLAEISYHAVAEWLRTPDSLVRAFGPDIFAQGSMRLDTTVRPLSYTEFDLDLVCQQHLDNLRRKSSAQRSGNSQVSVRL